VSHLLQPIEIRGRSAPSRILFGPHVTNLVRRNCFTERHAAFYAARARGGVGLLVLEQASVHPSDQPFELAPHGWADGFEDSLRQVGAAVRAAGPALVVAAIGHTGGQATGALSQRAVLAPSRVPEVATREMSKEAEPEEIVAIIAGFAAVATLVAEAGLDGVEVNAGQHSLVRQFLSGLTNFRTDAYGGDPERRLAFAHHVIAATRAALGDDRILGLRLSVDEFAPWAGITPEMGVSIAGKLTEGGAVDYVVVTRGGPYSVNRTQPGAFIAEPRDEGLIAQVRGALSPSVAVFAQGGIVDVHVATGLVETGAADGVEMTRALIADPDLPAKLGAGAPGAIRPCLLCNEDCQVRNNANYAVSCVHNPAAGHESEPEFAGAVTLSQRRHVLVVGAGPAGLEAALGAASLGHEVTVWEAAEAPGGAVRLFAAAPTRERYALSVEWRVQRLQALGVEVQTGRTARIEDLLENGADRIIVATGAHPRDPDLAGLGHADGPPVFTHRHVLAGPWPPRLQAALDSGGAVVLLDLADDFPGVSAMEILAARRGAGPLWLVTPAHFTGGAYLAPGGLPDFRRRLHAAGVRTWTDHDFVRAEGHRLVFRRRYGTEEAPIEDVSALIVCDREVPDDGLYQAGVEARLPVERIGDAVAPRRILDAVLEGGRAARRLGAVRPLTTSRGERGMERAEAR